MITIPQKIRYFLNSTIKTVTNSGYKCPSCGGDKSIVVERKFFVTSLRRCGTCNLLYRAPVTSNSEYTHFYQNDYSEGFTTDMPSDVELDKLKSRNFYGSGKDYSGYINILKSIGYEPGNSILDFGCSWGYGSWQFSKAGLKVIGYELSQNRCAFAKEKLGVEAHSDLNKLRGYPKFNFFFSSHVLEHIPRIHEVIRQARELVQPGGYFVAFTPNGSMEYRALNPRAFNRAWGFVHPLFIDPLYYASEFSLNEYLIDSSEYDVTGVKHWVAKKNFPQDILKTSGQELMIIVRL